MSAFEIVRLKFDPKLTSHDNLITLRTVIITIYFDHHIRFPCQPPCFTMQNQSKFSVQDLQTIYSQGIFRWVYQWNIVVQSASHDVIVSTTKSECVNLLSPCRRCFGCQCTCASCSSVAVGCVSPYTRFAASSCITCSIATTPRAAVSSSWIAAQEACVSKRNSPLLIGRSKTVKKVVLLLPYIQKSNFIFLCYLE